MTAAGYCTPRRRSKEVGVEIGDVVYFSKNSDYEMEVDGKKVWRMLVSDLMYVAPAEKE